MPPVRGQFGAGDEAGGVAGQEEAEIAGLLDRPAAPGPLPGLDKVVEGLAVLHAGFKVEPALGEDVAGEDGVDAHAVLGFVDRERPGEAVDAALGGAVGRGVPLADRADDAAEVDDAAARFAQMGERGACRRRRR